jgi:PPOX class probable F420-dependent enzyme
MSVQLPEKLLSLLRQPSLCFLATLMPDGSPQLTQTWVTTDGTSIILNVVAERQKFKNIVRDPRVAVNIVDPTDLRRSFAIRGRVTGTTTKGADASIDELSQKYLGTPYPNLPNTAGTRVIVAIEAESITPPLFD